MLLLEELLVRVFREGGRDVRLLVKSGYQPYLELLCNGTATDVAASAWTDEGRIETEIGNSLLYQYRAFINCREAGDSRRYRISPRRQDADDLQEEITEFYQQEEPASSSLAVFRYIAKKHPLMVWLSILNKLVKHLFAMLLPVFASNIIDALSRCHSFFDPEILWNVIASVAALTLNLICATLDYRFYMRFARGVESGFKMAMIQKLQILSMRFYQDMPTGTMLSKLVSDVQYIRLLITDHLQAVLYLAFDVVFVTIVALKKMPLMLIFYAIALPFVAWLLLHYSRPIRASKEEMRHRTETSNSAFKEMLSMARLTRAQGLQKTQYRELSAKVTEVQTASNDQDWHQVKLNNAGYGAFQGFRLACLVVSALMALRGSITVASVVLFLSLFDALVNSMQKFLDYMPMITQGLDSLKSVREILEARDIEKNGMRRLPQPVRGEITFENVRFGYDPEQAPVLDGVSFRIPAGTSAAFIGRSGTGKTTVLNLLLGLCAPQGGRILINGEDVDTLDKNSYRRSVAIVPQNPVLFSGTLWDNLVYGLNYVSADQVLQIIRRVGLESLVLSHPEGLMRPVTEGGENLSGGQRQRVSIARALLRDPRILIFDEATSALDTESEKEVQAAIEAAMGSCTELLVAHRLNTLSRVDRIYRIEDGRVTPA